MPCTTNPALDAMKRNNALTILTCAAALETLSGRLDMLIPTVPSELPS